jgi:hypothetical protein
MNSQEDKHPTVATSSADTSGLPQAGVRQQTEAILKGKTAQSPEHLKALSPEAALASQ